MNRTAAFKFWKRVYEYALKQMKRDSGGWTKCGTCNNYDFMIPWKSWRTTSNPVIDESVCGNCGAVNRWRMDCILPIPEKPLKA
jgi:hypothetical protein